MDRELIRDAMTREVRTTMKIGLIYFSLDFNEIEIGDITCVGKAYSNVTLSDDITRAGFGESDDGIS